MVSRATEFLAQGLCAFLPLYMAYLCNVIRIPCWRFTLWIWPWSCGWLDRIPLGLRLESCACKRPSITDLLMNSTCSLTYRCAACYVTARCRKLTHAQDLKHAKLTASNCAFKNPSYNQLSLCHNESLAYSKPTARRKCPGQTSLLWYLNHPLLRPICRLRHARHGDFVFGAVNLLAASER